MNVLEAAPDSRSDTEAEWYYGNKEKERLGPYSFADVRGKKIDGSFIID